MRRYDNQFAFDFPCRAIGYFTISDGNSGLLFRMGLCRRPNTGSGRRRVARGTTSGCRGCDDHTRWASWRSRRYWSPRFSCLFNLLPPGPRNSARVPRHETDPCWKAVCLFRYRKVCFLDGLSLEPFLKFGSDRTEVKLV